MPQDRILILEEGNQPHPRCTQCDMFSPGEALHWAHPTSVICRHRSERKVRRLVVEDTEECKGRVFSAYGKPLTAVPLFKYLGRTSLSSDNDWQAGEQNLQRARGEWG